MTVLDTNVVAIVLPTIARDLRAGFADIEWVISTYVLCFASLLLPAGSIADRFGRRKIFLFGIGLFAVASLFCGAAPTAALLYLARAVQGIGAAFLLAPALAIIGHAFHEETERARAWAIWGGMMGLTMVLSPILGGVIAFYFGWRWAFYVNVPICIALATAVLTFVDDSSDPDTRKLDPTGIILFAGSMFGLTWWLINGQAHGWVSPIALLGLIGGVLAFAGFMRAEAKHERPMLDVTLFRISRFVGAVLAMFAYAASAQVMASLLPLYLQNGLGKPALDAGFAMLPFALAMLILPQIGRRLGRHLAPYQILVLGLSIVCIGNLTTAWAASVGHWPLVMLGMTILGSGGGLLNGDTQKAVMGSIPRDRAGMASGISTTARFSGILLGFATLSALLATVARSSIATALCTAVSQACQVKARFSGMVIAGDLPGAIALVPPGFRDSATHLAHQGYAEGFSAALLGAAAIAVSAAVLVALLMRPAEARETPANTVVIKERGTS